MNQALTITRTNSHDADFLLLVKQLDNDLQRRYQEEQATYDGFNILSFIETVVVVYESSKPVACGCFKAFDSSSVEIKRMFVIDSHRGRGISKMVLNELEQWAREKSFYRAVLETATEQPEAIGLYTRHGYTRIPNYGPYVNMPKSVCYEKQLT